MTRAYSGRLGTVALVGLVASVVLVGAMVVGVSGPRGTVLVLWWLGTAGGMTALAVLVRRWEGATAAAIAAGAVAGIAPALAMGAAMSWREPIVLAGWRCGTADVMLVTSGIPFVAVAAMVGALLGALVVRHAGPGLGRWLLALVGVATLATAGAVGSTASRPGPDAWLSTLPEVARFTFTAREGAPGATASRHLPGGQALVRTCVAPDWDGPVQCQVQLGPVTEATDGFPTVDANDELVVRQVPATGWLVIDSGGRRMAFDQGAPLTITPAMAGDAVGAPPALAWGWGAGLLVAALLQGARRRLTRRRGEVAEGREGHSDGQSLVFADGELPARGEPSAPVAEGPIVAVPERVPGRPTYRDDGATTRWHATAGPRVEQLTTLDRWRLGLDLLSAAVLTVAALPIAVAAATFV